MAYIATQIISADPGWVAVEDGPTGEIVYAVISWALMRDMLAQNEPNRIGPVVKSGPGLQEIGPEYAAEKNVQVRFDEELYDAALEAGGWGRSAR